MGLSLPKNSTFEHGASPFFNALSISIGGYVLNCQSYVICIVSTLSLIISDLRNPTTTPLNFTKSINLALSERGINSMRSAKTDGLLDDVLKETIPMHGRMIHGKGKDDQLTQESQAYDIRGRVCLPWPMLWDSLRWLSIVYSSSRPRRSQQAPPRCSGETAKCHLLLQAQVNWCRLRPQHCMVWAKGKYRKNWPCPKSYTKQRRHPRPTKRAFSGFWSSYRCRRRSFRSSVSYDEVCSAKLPARVYWHAMVWVSHWSGEIWWFVCHLAEPSAYLAGRIFYVYCHSLPW